MDFFFREIRQLAGVPVKDQDQPEGTLFPFLGQFPLRASRSDQLRCACVASTWGVPEFETTTIGMVIRWPDRSASGRVLYCNRRLPITI